MDTLPPGRKRHLLLKDRAQTQPYTYPKAVRGASMKLPSRNRQQHGADLARQLEEVKASLEALHQKRVAAGIQGDRGLYLEFSSEPEFEVALRSLDRTDRRGDDHIELVAVRQQGTVMLATVFVPEGRISELERLIEKYIEEDTVQGRPKNRPLVESISTLRRAVLESFWTDAPELFPDDHVSCWWEVWLRAKGDHESLLAEFRHHAQHLKIRVGEHILKFPDRTVILAYATPQQVISSVELLDCIAELRRAKEVASFFTGLSPREQADWATSFLDGVAPPSEVAPAVCLLDTGINRAHPLLRLALDEEDLHACHPAWSAADHWGHGTEMAGLALYGDLTEALVSRRTLSLEHRLESVKILPPPGFADNDPELYGALTKEGLARAEIAAPERRRAVSMAVTATDGRDRGAPSSWSAEVDRLCHGSDDGVQRLFFVSAGNIHDQEKWRAYPDTNDVEQVHDPGQAWNALTIGAYTEKIQFDGASYPGWSPIAPHGSLSPSSTTSVTWKSMWPNKPDVVLEGGNAARDPSGNVDCPDDLRLLTTYWESTDKLFVPTGDTSAATAQAARMGAILSARYPDLWPETLRALLVHAAEWTPAMRQASGHHLNLLLRRHGYGVPSLDRACWSASNLLTLIAQDDLQPFVKPAHDVRTKDMNLYELPWPQAQLEQLFDTQVELRVTLSYFVEPNPARRGWKYKHRYASHGLRFAMRNPGESLKEFQARVSKDAQEETGAPEFREPGWMLGPFRNRGSIHSDRWTGTAVDLAGRQHLAVFPVSGWWKERPQLERWRNRVRYALVVSIHAPETGVDIYMPVEAMIATPIEIE